MAKKTLADQISDLYNETPGDYDIEDAERGLFQHQENGSDAEEGGSEEEEDDDALRSQHYLNVGKSKLRAGQVVQLKGERYKGKASSRSEIFGESDHEEHQGEEEEDESEDQDQESDPESESQSESEQENNQVSADEEEEEEEEEEIDGELDSEDQEQSDDSEDQESGSDDEQTVGNDKRSKLKQLMANERKLIINRLSTSTQTDAIKGYAVVSQQQTFDKIIDIRMKLQKAVTSSNLLPLNNETYDEFVEDDTNEKLESAESSLHTLLDSILALRTTTYNKAHLTKEPLQYNNSKKRTFEQYAQETNKLDTILSKTRESILTKWSLKVDSASGASALQGNKFKSLNANAAQQVEMNLMDMDRLVKRTRMNRRDVKPLGYVDEVEQEENGDEEEDQKTAKKHIDRTLKEREYIFDDEDFYRVLLNDLVDRKISSSNPTSGLTIQLTKTKFKKNVDTKASKGRKLRYAPQEKLINWEAPRGTLKWNDEQIDEFCAGLFGQRVNFDEDDEDLEVSDEDEDLKNDDLRIFG